MNSVVAIGAGAGFAGDRTDAAGPVADALARFDGPALPDVRDAWPSARWRWRSSSAGAIPRAASIRRWSASSARCWGAACATTSGSSAISARPIRAAPPSGFSRWRASRGLKRRASRWSKATTCAARCRRRTLPRAKPTARSCAMRARESHRGQCLSRRGPDRGGARAGRRHRRDRARRRLRAGARAADARVRLARRRLGRGSPPARSPAICWNAARRSPAAISPIRRSRPCRAWPTSAIRSPRSSADGGMVDRQARGHRRPRRPPDRDRADALRDPRSGRLSRARRRARCHRRHGRGGRGRPRPCQRRARQAARPRP